MKTCFGRQNTVAVGPKKGRRRITNHHVDQFRFPFQRRQRILRASLQGALIADWGRLPLKARLTIFSVSPLARHSSLRNSQTDSGYSFCRNNQVLVGKILRSNYRKVFNPFCWSESLMKLAFTSAEIVSFSSGVRGRRLEEPDKFAFAPPVRGRCNFL